MEKHDESLHSAHEQASKEEEEEEDSDFDAGFDHLGFPEVPKASIQPRADAVSAPAVIPPSPSAPHPQVDNEALGHSEVYESLSRHLHPEPQEASEERTGVDPSEELPDVSVKSMEEKQFVPFISPPMSASASFSARQNNPTPPPALSRTKTEGGNIDLQDVLAAAHAAAETAERAAAAARLAASLAQVRITEIMKKNDHDQVLDSGSGHPFHTDNASDQSPPTTEKPHDPDKYQASEAALNLPSFDGDKVVHDHVIEDKPGHHLPQRLPSMDEDSYFSYPNLFASQGSNLGSGDHRATMDNSRPDHED